jgi:hypothetical protein
MKVSLHAAFAAFLATALFTGMPAARGSIVTLEDVPLTGPYAQDWRPANGFTSSGAFFNNDYNAGFGSWADFALSRVIDNTTEGFGNQYAAFAPARGAGAGAGLNGSLQYAVGYVSDFSPLPRVTFAQGERPLTLAITNTTYGALSMRNGDGYGKKFGGTSGNDPDFFKLTISGRDASNGLTGTLEFFLADYRFGNNASDYIVSDWTTLDVSGFGLATRALEFTVTSSDNDPQFGIKTPAYFAVDNITTVPEPATAVLLLLGITGIAARRPRA